MPLSLARAFVYISTISSSSSLLFTSLSNLITGFNKWEIFLRPLGLCSISPQHFPSILVPFISFSSALLHIPPLPTPPLPPQTFLLSPSTSFGLCIRGSSRWRDCTPLQAGDLRKEEDSMYRNGVCCRGEVMTLSHGLRCCVEGAGTHTHIHARPKGYIWLDLKTRSHLMGQYC